MSDELQYRQRVVELSTAIVITAMKTGKLDAENPEAVAKYYDVVSTQMMRNALIDLPELFERKMKKHVVNP